MNNSNLDTAKIKQNAFHAHLDKCAQCANNPFALCSVGLLLLKKAIGVK